MAWNGSQKAIIDRRRTLVARARLHGATQREIVEALRKQGEFNRDTGKPWALVTVNRDLKAIQKAWQADAQRDIAEYTSEQIAELREVRRKAWSLVRLDTVLRSLTQEAKLLGLDAPSRVDMTTKGERLGSISDDDRLAAGLAVYDAIRARADPADNEPAGAVDTADEGTG